MIFSHDILSGGIANIYCSYFCTLWLTFKPVRLYPIFADPGTNFSTKMNKCCVPCHVLINALDAIVETVLSA